MITLEEYRECCAKYRENVLSLFRVEFDAVGVHISSLPEYIAARTLKEAYSKVEAVEISEEIASKTEDDTSDIVFVQVRKIERIATVLV